MGTKIWQRQWNTEHNPLFSKYSIWYMLMENACKDLAKRQGLDLVISDSVPTKFDERNLYLINLGNELDIVNVEFGVPKVAKVIPE
jgi:hypothetical protein